ncbi:MAG TPA: prepilin-type N-terminal cleavage/methylation domain-containing protein [Patescibacteria group bacterium]|nr:prepilin-type N-terminal cleavage/methylation domain-containing protein [bacterium]HRY56825.1 prepilin-type N-terminal cleavage/methylation domain-containing protein [Patescibacteria group bacterium]
MNANLPNHSKGFTLIELLVVMSIIAILGGGIIPSFSRYLKDQNLKQAQEQLKSDLRTIQNKALTGASSNEEINGVRARYWGVYLRSGSETVDYFISTDTSSCLPIFSGTTQNGISKGNFKIPNTIVFRGSNNMCLFFDIKNGDIVSSVGNIPINIDYASPNETVGKDVTFNSAGLIY